jgi:hypothetical protein
MSQAPKDTRSAAEKARDTANIIGSLKHEGYVPNAEDEAIHQKAGAKSRVKKPSRFFANAPLSKSERCALLPTVGGIVAQPKKPLDERALDRLTLATDAAVAAYQEQRLRLQTTRKVRDNRQRADLAQTQIGEDDEIA